MNGARILLVEDEPGLVLTLTDLLESDGYVVDPAMDFGSAQAGVAAGVADLVILDLMLPGGSGLDVLRTMRTHGDTTPVLVLTARSAPPDRVIGLKLGADDYLGKPFDSMELLARVEALLRRAVDRPREPGRPADGGVVTADVPGVYRFGDIELDTGRSEVRKSGETLPLTMQEYRLLAFLVEHPGKTLSRERLLDEVWGYESDVASRTVDVHVSSLRQKMGDDPNRPRWIVTVRGFGYRFEGGKG